MFGQQEEGAQCFSRECNTGIALHLKYNSWVYHVFHEDLMTRFLASRFKSTFPHCICLMVIVFSVTIPMDYCSV